MVKQLTLRSELKGAVLAFFFSSVGCRDIESWNSFNYFLEDFPTLITIFLFQNERVNSVRDALACLVSKEPLTGYVCSKTGQEVEASRQSTLENLPEILILHLKCFVYDKSGGCQKLLKRIDFTSDLELSKGSVGVSN